MRLHGFIAASAVAVLSAGGAAAQERARTGELVTASADIPLVDPLNIIGARTEKPVSETPASVSVITDTQIEQQLITDIKDLVRYEPGVSVRQSPARFGAALGTTGRDGNAGFNIRGLEGNRVLIQVDGVRVPDSFSFGAQNVGRGDYGDLDLLKRVEILKGSASALYGSDGVAGAVSFTTKDPVDFLKGDRSIGGLVKGGYASADEGASAGVVLAGQQDRLSGMVAYTRREGHEQETFGFNFSGNSDRTAANPQDVVSNAILAKGVFEVNNANALKLTYEHFDRDVDAIVLSGLTKPPLAAASVIGLIAADTTQRDRVSLDHFYTGADSGWLTRARLNAYWQAATTVQFTAEDRNTAADRTRLNTFDNEVIGVSGQAQSVFGAHHLIWGADYSVTRQEGLRDGTVPPAGEPFPIRAFPNTDYTLAGVFVQDEITLLDGRLTLFPAIRYDWYKLDPEPDGLIGALVPATQSDGHVSPKFAATFAVTDELNLFANVGLGFKAPSPSQVNNAFANPIQNYRSEPNPDLKPETSETAELGLHFKRGGSFLSLSAFTGRYEDFITQVQIGGTFTPADPAVFQYVNLGEVKIHGWEGKFQRTFENGFGGLLAIAYAKGEANSAGVSSPLDSVDPLKLVAGVTYSDPAGKFGGALTATHSNSKKTDRVAQVCTGGCFLPPQFTVIDLTAYWNITDNVTLNGGMFNLTDEKYWWWNDVRGVSATSVARDAYTQPGRNVSVAVSYKF